MEKTIKSEFWWMTDEYTLSFKIIAWFCGIFGVCIIFSSILGLLGLMIFTIIEKQLYLEFLIGIISLIILLLRIKKILIYMCEQVKYEK
jgi:hypothetical protein